MAGKGGGAWKVAYADFVTAMMAFFMVMWIVGQNEEVREEVANYFRDPGGSRHREGGLGYLPGVNSQQPLGPDPTKKGGGIRPWLAMIHNQRGTSLSGSVTFAEGTTELDEAARDRLADLVPLVVGKPNTLEIRAHIPRGPDTGTAELFNTCYQRSLAVMTFLSEKGVDPKRFRLSQAGPNEPLADATDPHWRERNSRVDVIMLDSFAPQSVEPSPADTASAAH